MGRFPVIAVAKGYFGSKIRVPGDRFEVSDEEFSDVWMERAYVAAPVPTAPVLQPVAPVAGGPVVIPADWRTIHYSKRIAIAKAISGMDDVSAEMAVTIIEAEANARDDVARGIVKAPPAPVTLTADQVEAAAIAEAQRIADAAAAADAASGEPDEEDENA